MSKKTRSYHRIDEHSFNAIKTLIGTGLSGKEIQRAMGVSPSTFWRIKKADTLEEYFNITVQKNYPKAEETSAARCVDRPEINYGDAQLDIIIELMNKLLEEVSAIANNTKPKGFFH